jgi:hypothetical protein
MPQIAVLAREPVAPPVRPQRRALADIKAHTAGLGAIGFVVVVVLQNIVRGLSAPANDAPTREVLNHYADHRAVTAVLACTFVLGGIALAGFLGGAMRRLTAGDRPGWAYIGAIGAIGIMVIFAVLVGTEEALSVVATGSTPDLASMDALWALHNSVFTVLFASIAIALLGLSRAGVAAGITPPAFERLAPVGFVLLSIAAASGPFIAAGDAMPAFGIGAAGFLIWLAFLVTTGRRLVRS